MMKNKSSNDCEFDTDFSKLKRKTKKLPSVDCMTEGSYSIDASILINHGL